MSTSKPVDSSTMRAAVLWAADHIESKPRAFDPTTIYVPMELTDRGDALGWIGYALKLKGEAMTTSAVAYSMGMLDTRAFYKRMNLFDPGWEQSTHQCAAALRSYAEKYFPAGISRP